MIQYPLFFGPIYLRANSGFEYYIGILIVLTGKFVIWLLDFYEFLKHIFVLKGIVGYFKFNNHDDDGNQFKTSSIKLRDFMWFKIKI